jgi:phage terminase small subunit
VAGRWPDARRERFVLEYLQDCNASAAAIRAGYSPRTANNTGYRLMQRPEVQRAIAEAQAARAQELGDSAEQAARDLLAWCRAAAEDRDWRALGKLQELRMKHLGMLTERIEHSGPGGGPIQLAHDAARRIVEDSGAADLAHTLFERVVQHTGQPGLDVVGPEVAGRAAPAPAKPPAD